MDKKLFQSAEDLSNFKQILSSARCRYRERLDYCDEPSTRKWLHNKISWIGLMREKLDALEDVKKKAPAKKAEAVKPVNAVASSKHSSSIGVSNQI